MHRIRKRRLCDGNMCVRKGRNGEGIHLIRTNQIKSTTIKYLTWILNAHGLGIFNRRNFLDLDTGRIKANLQVDVKIEFELNIGNGGVNIDAVVVDGHTANLGQSAELDGCRVG